jgi:hypothetical protein
MEIGHSHTEGTTPSHLRLCQFWIGPKRSIPGLKLESGFVSNALGIGMLRGVDRLGRGAGVHQESPQTFGMDFREAREQEIGRLLRQKYWKEVAPLGNLFAADPMGKGGSMFRCDVKMDIVPHEAVGPLRFGMPRKLVARALGTVADRGKPTPSQAVNPDFFFDSALRVDYDDDDLCAEVEFSHHGRWSLSYGGYDPFAHPVLEVLDWAKTLDPGLKIDSVGFLSNELGVGMYAEFMLSPRFQQEFANNPPQTFVIFRPDFREVRQAELGRLLRARYPKNRLKSDSLRF